MREQNATIAMGVSFGGWKIVLVLEYPMIQVRGSDIISHSVHESLDRYRRLFDDQRLEHHKRARKKVLFSTQCIQNFGYEDKVSDMS